MEQNAFLLVRECGSRKTALPAPPTVGTRARRQALDDRLGALQLKYLYFRFDSTPKLVLLHL
jgi:hypothetical protein